MIELTLNTKKRNPALTSKMKQISALTYHFRAAMCLARSMTNRPGGEDNPRIKEISSSTSTGIDYDLYEPCSGSEKTVITIHGLTLEGEKDSRLVNFSRTLAESNIRTAAISLPKIKSFKFSELDIKAIENLVTFLYNEYGGKIGIVAFSAGAGLALCAATRSPVSNHIDPLILFGPYYSLSMLWHSIVENYNKSPSSDTEWDNFIWLRMVMAYRVLDTLALSNEEKKEVADFLRSYCHITSIEQKRSFYTRILKGRDNTNIKGQTDDEETQDNLSIKGKCSLLTAKTFIIHDINDHLIPPEHSEKLYEELCSRDVNTAQQLLITPLLSHVTGKSIMHFFDIFQMIRIFRQLYS